MHPDLPKSPELEPIVWRVRCAAAECRPDPILRPVSRPVEIRGTRAQAVAELRRLGWRPCPANRPQTRHWWCPTHASRGGVA